MNPAADFLKEPPVAPINKSADPMRCHIGGQGCGPALAAFAQDEQRRFHRRGQLERTLPTMHRAWNCREQCLRSGTGRERVESADPRRRIPWQSVEHGMIHDFPHQARLGTVAAVIPVEHFHGQHAGQSCAVIFPSAAMKALPSADHEQSRTVSYATGKIVHPARWKSSGRIIAEYVKPIRLREQTGRRRVAARHIIEGKAKVGHDSGQIGRRAAKMIVAQITDSVKHGKISRRAEIRNPKSQTNSKHGNSKKTALRWGKRETFRTFGFLFSDLFEISYFLFSI